MTHCKCSLCYVASSSAELAAAQAGLTFVDWSLWPTWDHQDDKKSPLCVELTDGDYTANVRFSVVYTDAGNIGFRFVSGAHLRAQRSKTVFHEKFETAFIAAAEIELDRARQYRADRDEVEFCREKALQLGNIVSAVTNQQEVIEAENKARAYMRANVNTYNSNTFSLKLVFNSHSSEILEKFLKGVAAQYESLILQHGDQQ